MSKELDQEITRQAQRFSAFPGVSEDPKEAKRQYEELRKAFRAACASVETVRMVSDRVMATARYFPLPVDVESAAETVRPEAAHAAARPICQICHGDGFLPEPPAFRNSVRYERVKRCSCDRQASFEDRAAAGEYRPPTDDERYGTDDIFAQAAEAKGL